VVPGLTHTREPISNVSFVFCPARRHRSCWAGTHYSPAGPSMGAGSSLFTGSRGRASSAGGGARARPIAVYKPSPALNLDAAAPCEVVTPTKRPPPSPKERARQHGKEKLGSRALSGNGHMAALLPRQDSNVSSTSRASTARSPTSSPRRGKTQTGG
jgi:hypothetical protein